MFEYYKMNGSEWSEAERKECPISLFENFRTERGKLFIPPKLKKKEYGGK